MKILLINDSASDPNWGDRAAAFTLKIMMRASGGDIHRAISEHELGTSTFTKRAPGMEPELQGTAASPLKQMVPPLFWETMRKMARGLNIGPSHSPIPKKWEGFQKLAELVARNPRTWHEFLCAANDVDIAVVHGNGCMMGNGLVARTELFLSYFIKKYLQKPVIIVNHTGDFSDPDLLRIAQEVYPLFDDVVFRDQISVQRCGEFCKGRFAPDTAFWFEPASSQAWWPVAQRPTYFDVWPDTASFDPAKPYLCIGGSSIIGTQTELSALRSSYVQLIEHLQSVYPGQIVLTVSDPVDCKVLSPLGPHLGLPVIGLTTPTQQAVDILGNSEAYIGGRWHSGIFALRGGAPIVALSSKTFKMQALSEMAGFSSEVFDVWQLGYRKQAIAQQLLEYLEAGSDLRQGLRRWAEESAKESWGNVAYLREYKT